MINVNNGVNYKIAICDDDMNYVEYIKNLIRECFMGKLEFWGTAAAGQRSDARRAVYRHAVRRD